MRLSELIKELETIRKLHGDAVVIIHYKDEDLVPSPTLWLHKDKDDKIIKTVVDLLPSSI